MRKILILTLLATLVVGALPAQAGDGDEQQGSKQFRMFGAGFGHGLGFSQWGGFGLAKQGWGAEKIVKHYYSGTRVVRTDSAPNGLRIGLVQGKDSVRLNAQSAGVELRLGGPQGPLVATVPSGATWKVSVAGNEYRIVTEAGETVDTVGGPDDQLFAVYQSLGSRVRVPEAFHTYNRGKIEFDLYDCDAGDCVMRLVLSVDPQGYLYGLGEVPSSWPMAAMKAQAIAARTYAFTKAAASQHRAVCDCALYATANDQVYAGWDKEGGVDGDRWVSAVNQTSNKVIMEGNQTIQAFYMSSSGGFTENNENVWGGSPIGYLRGVCDPGDFTTANPNATWVETFTTSEVTQGLGLGIGAIEGFADEVRGVSGRIISVTVRGANGERSISGNTLRSALGLHDDRVWINANRLVTGPIRDKYDKLGCSPGMPMSAEVGVAGGRRQKFQDGVIYFIDGAGAHELHGPVLTHYGKKGGPAGSLGFPTSDVQNLQNGNRRANFEHGVITCDGANCSVG
ncbi:MAG TPA: SpoIID/LytB domain-containing protein [Actinomycetota bacterium]|nr:SpoIID/LytB domain-containing protein [Actinomycetota bacterium]